MKCDICKILIDSVDAAIDIGWDPYFYEGDKEHGPACPSCSETMIDIGKDGEMELKVKYYGKI